MQRRFQPFCLLSNHQNLSHMVGSNPNNTLCGKCFVFFFFINSVWAPSFHLAGADFFFAWIFSVVVDMSQIMPICYFCERKGVRSPQAVSPPLSPHLCSA